MSDEDLTKFISGLVEDTFYSNNLTRAIYNYNKLANKNLPHIFRRFVVLDVILDRTQLNDEKIRDYTNRFGEIDNIAHATSMIVPRNTIIAKQIFNKSLDNRHEALNPVILYPFFPSHLSFPCKPGEHVWVMFESITEHKSLGYWLFRIVGPDHVDDVNHTHAPREYDSTFEIDPTKVVSDRTKSNPSSDFSEKKPRYHFKNGLYRTVSTNTEDGTNQEIVEVNTAYVLPNKNFPDFNISKIYEDLLTTSDASKRIVYEPVPRYKKNPGDLSIEGSNNSLIVLGVDKVLPSESSGSIGTIDIVTGRGSTTDTFGNFVQNELESNELDKHYLNLLEKEGDVDYDNDRSRILVSQRTKPNLGFNLTKYNEVSAPGEPSRPKITDSPDGDAAVIVRSDKVKIVARSDIQFIVQGFSEGENPVGVPIKNGNTDVKTWASITIKSNGDIVFTPSNSGYIKLGGDDADRAIVCTAKPVNTTTGFPYGDAIENNAGGQMAGARGVDKDGKCLSAVTDGAGVPSTNHGTFASKVLVK